MDFLRRHLVILMWLIIGYSNGQQISVDQTIPIENLIENNLIQGCVEVSNISSPVNGGSVGLNSFGYFERSTSNFPFENGIVLTTGSAYSAGNTLNTSVLNEGSSSWPTDMDLETALGVSGTLNATSIQFDFISASNQIQFNYILASEEYFANFPCEYSDGFAFLIREAGSSNPFTNIALVPGTAVPVNTNTVHDEIVGFCAASNEQFFDGYNLGDTNYNGRTTVLSATATIQPNVQYQIKLIIADQSDHNYDSAVFIEGNSFNASVDLGEDFSTCATSVDLNGDINNPDAIYSWYFNGTLIPNYDLPILNASLSGNYRVEIEIPLSNNICTIEDDINIEISTTQPSEPLMDYELCDDISNNGHEYFDLSLKDSEVLASVPPSSYNISYHISLSDAENDINPISAPFQNTVNPQTLYVRIEDAISGCLAFSNFNLVVHPMPIVTYPTPLEVCDDQLMDGFTSIDLTIKDDEITNGNTDLVVTYHYTIVDAQNGINTIPMPYVNTNINEQVYVGIENPITGCRTTTTLDITVLDIPIIDRGEHYIDACDSDHDGFAEFDLTSIIPEVLNGLSDVTVTFHETNDDALTGINPIADETNYSNIQIDEQIVYIRVESNNTGCASVTPIEIHTNLLLSATNINDVSSCDVDNDGMEEFDFASIAIGIINNIPDVTIEFYESEEDRDNGVNPIDPNSPYSATSNPQTVYLSLSSPTCSDVAEIQLVLYPIIEFDSVGITRVCDENQDGYTTTDLSQFDSLVTEGLEGFTVTYFLSEADANANLNPLPNNYTNVDNPFILYPRIMFQETGCADVNSFQVEVLPAPESLSPNDIIICDADRDGNEIIDLSSNISQVLNDFTNRSVSIHSSLQDANLNTNPIPGISSYIAQTETLFIRIENTVTGCHSIEELDILINNLPYIGNYSNNLSPYNICENNSDGIGEFIFENKDAEALDGQTGMVVSYYLTQSNAQNKVNAIDKTSPYSNTSNPQTIFIRVENVTDETCQAISSFTIEVGSNPAFNEPTDWFVCDDTSNDGISNFDLSVKLEEISNGIPNIQNIQFFANEADALNNANELPLNFTNTINPQEIYATINNGTICSSITSFVINVIQVPEINPSIPIVVCDTDYDGSVNLDLTQAELNILDVRQNDIDISYFESISDAEAHVNEINNPQSYFNISNPQTVFIKITNTISNCYAIEPIDIQVNLPPIINDFGVYDICANNTNSINLSEINSVAINDSAEIEIAYFLNENDARDNNNSIGPNYTYQSNFDILFLRATNIDTGCFSVYEFSLNVNPIPIAHQPPDLVVCDDDFDGLYEFDLSQQNLTILGNQNSSDYTITYHNSIEEAQNDELPIDEIYFAFDGELIFVRIENITTGCYANTQFTTTINPLPPLDIGNQVICLDNLPLLISANTNNPNDQYLWSTGETAPEIEITEVGDYWVNVLTEYGCENTESFSVIESEAATIEATEVIDFSDPNNITVTISGIGDYLYQLDDGQPQESNVFENVRMGYHTITIIDINGCAEVTREVLVIDIPKHMTPNGDGNFDTWHIVGVETLPGTVISIFDRYGKLLKIITSDSQGWDGTYNGAKMPSSDYWFVADVVQDDETFQIKGHFAIKR